MLNFCHVNCFSILGFWWHFHIHMLHCPYLAYVFKYWLSGESLKAIDLPTYILDSDSTPKQPLESISAPCRMHPLTAFEVELGQLRFSVELLRSSEAPGPAPSSPVDNLPLPSLGKQELPLCSDWIRAPCSATANRLLWTLPYSSKKSPFCS